MKFRVMQLTVMAGKLGDIFWDLAPWITYSPGYDLGCSIYVANPTSEKHEYALIARLTRNTTLISEEALPVFGLTWFEVEPGDFIELHGALRFTESDAVLTVQLVERETEQVTDSVSTLLVAPTTAALPPAWPGTTATTTTNWLSMMMPVMMMGIFGVMIVSAFKPAKEKEAVPPEKKLLPPGRRE